MTDNIKDLLKESVVVKTITASEDFKPAYIGINSAFSAQEGTGYVAVFVIANGRNRRAGALNTTTANHDKVVEESKAFVASFNTNLAASWKSLGVSTAPVKEEEEVEETPAPVAPDGKVVTNTPTTKRVAK